MTNIDFSDIEYDETADRKAEEFEPTTEDPIKLRLYDSQCRKPATNQNDNKGNYENKTE